MDRGEQGRGGRERVWERPRSGRNGPVVGILISALAVFGALIVGLSVREGSVSQAGARVDAWITGARSMLG